MSLYMLLSLLAMVFCFALAIIAIARDHRKEIIIFAAASACIGGWTAFPFLTTVITNPQWQLRVGRFVYLVAAFVPYLFWYLYFTVIELHDTLDRWVLRLAFGSSLIFALLAWNPQYIRGICATGSFRTVIPGPLFFIFVVYFGAIGLYGSCRMLARFRNATGMLKNRYKYLFLGFGIAYFGGLLHFAGAYAQKEPIPHDLFVVAFVGILAYAIQKHRLMDIELLARDALSLASTTLLILVPFLGLTFVTHNIWFARFLMLSAAICYIVAYRPVLAVLQPFIDKHLFGGKFSYLAELGQIRRQTFRHINLRDMLVEALAEVIRVMRLQRAALYMHDLTSNSYDPIVEHPAGATNGYTSFSENNPLILELKAGGTTQVLVGHIVHQAFGLFHESSLFAFLLLGPKEDGGEIHAEDLRELRDLKQTLEQGIWYTHVFYEQSLMLSKFSHDNIRYANNIRQQAEALADPSTGTLNEFQKHVIGIADRDAKMLEEYLQDLRVTMAIVSQRLRGTYQMMEYDLGQIVLEVLESQRVRAAKQGIELKSSLLHAGVNALDPFVGWGEIKSIRHVVENLLSNALKFTPPGGSIRIDVKSLGHQLELIIADTGPGIPQEELPHIFDLFFQGKSRRNMQQSTGLGLSIVKEIVAIHHGNIDVESQIDQGTVFYVRLPARRYESIKAA